LNKPKIQTFQSVFQAFLRNFAALEISKDLQFAKVLYSLKELQSQQTLIGRTLEYQLLSNFKKLA
jgi:hypothetical protein